ncbi:hypothetical protein P4K66_13305 [Bacillus anthracis]|uniref:hypothetical protein n=1 Tax=Bacillus anthracis TaxID=1392 RepID=UPI002DBB055C|nr:hypothetical protein [Bacillus anthracis]MEC0017444.1 hypothetical protein [Bacillus anthracis]
MPKEKYEELHDELDPLVNSIDNILHGEPWKRADETALHNKLVNIFSELLNKNNYMVLADHSKEEIEELYEKFSSATPPYYSVWADYLQRLYYLNTDLKGKFIFNLGRRKQKEKQEYNLNGRTLEILRYKNPNKDLALKLFNVDKIIIDSGHTIKVQATDSFGNVIAEWDEYKKTDSVALVRFDSNEYEYKWISAKK